MDQALFLGFLVSLVKSLQREQTEALGPFYQSLKEKKISGRESCKPQLLSGRGSGGSGVGMGLYRLSQCRGHTLGGQQPHGREGAIQ